MSSIKPSAAQIAQQQAAQRQGGTAPVSAQEARSEDRYGIGTGENWTPPPIATIEDTGLHLIGLSELVLKVLYFSGFMTGYRIAEVIKLPYTGIVDQVMDFLKREQAVEVKGSGGL